MEYTTLYASDTVEAELDIDYWPEQAQLDHQSKELFFEKLEILVTDLVAKYPSSIWWMTIASGAVQIACFFAVEYVKHRNPCDGRELPRLDDLCVIKFNSVMDDNCSAPFLYFFGLSALPFIIVGLFVWSCFLFLLNSFMDPGAIEKYPTEKVLALEADLQREQPDEFAKAALVVQSVSAKPQFVMKRQYTWKVSGQEILTEWCYHCNIFKAPRVHHCKICGHCIERFDHHCPWLDNCVGIRNYRWFLLMLISYGVMWILLPSFSVVHIVLRGLHAPRQELGFLVTTVFEVAAAGANLHFLFILLRCQYDLMKMGITVHEFKTDKYFNKTLNKFQSPFDRGLFLANLHEACCSPWRPCEAIAKSQPPAPDTVTEQQPPNKETPKKRSSSSASSNVAVKIRVPEAKAKSYPTPVQLSTITEDVSGEISMSNKSNKKTSNHMTIDVVPIEPVIV